MDFSGTADLMVKLPVSKTEDSGGGYLG